MITALCGKPPDTSVAAPAARTVAELIKEASDSLGNRNDYSAKNAAYIMYTWKQFQDFCDSHGRHEYCDSCQDEFLGELNNQTPPLKPDTIRRKASHMKMLALFARDGFWNKKALSLLPELPPEFHEYLDVQEKHLIKTGRAEVTRQTMRDKTRRILRHFQSSGLSGLSEIDESYISSYLLSLTGHANSTIRCELSALRGVLSNLYLTGYTSDDLSVHVPRYRLGQSQSMVKIWESDEIRKVLEAVDRSSPKGKRDAAYITIAAELGVRSGDIRNLKCSDIDWELCSISFVQSKTNRLNVLPLNEKVGEAIIDYLRVRPQTDCEYLFVNLTPPYGQMTSFKTIFEQYVSRSGVKIPKNAHHGLHSLRATVATKLLAANVSPDTIFPFLGHSDRETLNHYLRMDIENLRECALSFEDGELI